MAAVLQFRQSHLHQSARQDKPFSLPGEAGAGRALRDQDPAGGTDGYPRGDLDPAEFCELAREIVSAVLDVPVEEISRPTRSVADTCRARHAAMYLAHVIFQIPLSAIAVSFGRERTSVAHAVRRIEDHRDEAAFERLILRLERLAACCLALRAVAEVRA